MYGRGAAPSSIRILSLLNTDSVKLNSLEGPSCETTTSKADDSGERCARCCIVASVVRPSLRARRIRDGAYKDVEIVDHGRLVSEFNQLRIEMWRNRIARDTYSLIDRGARRAHFRVLYTPRHAHTEVLAGLLLRGGMTCHEEPDVRRSCRTRVRIDMYLDRRAVSI